MRVSIVRQGGFAGLTTATTLDSAALAADGEAELRRLVEGAGVFELPEGRAAARQPDRFGYALTVEDGERRRTVRLAEEELPPAVRSLISWVERAPGRQRQGRPPGGPPA